MTKAEELDAVAMGQRTTPLTRSQDDEPVFVLVARDKFAAHAVRRWADIVEASTLPGSPGRAKADEARAFAKQMVNWADANYGGGKVPD